MKRYAATLVLALLAALPLVGTAGASHEVTSPVKGSFKYCSDPTFPPMESTTTAGKPTGFDIDMANAIGKLWKVKANFVQTAFPGLLPGLISLWLARGVTLTARADPFLPLCKLNLRSDMFTSM